VVNFSNSAGPEIVLEPLNELLAPSGFVISGEGRFHLSWNSYPGALCYSVYKAVDELDPFGNYKIVAECITDNFIDLDTFGPGPYRVSAITLDGETELSDPLILGAGSQVITIVALEPSSINEDDAVSGFFRITRTGFPVGVVSVFYAISGTATNGVDYDLIPDFATIPDGQSFVDVEIVPMPDNEGEDDETVILTLDSAVGYAIGNPDTATITILDGCDQGGVSIPADFTLQPPGSLGIFSVSPDGSPVSVSANAPVGDYTAIYRGGSIRGTATAPTCFDLLTFPHGFEVNFGGGNTSISDTTPPPGQFCYALGDQAGIEADVPIGKVYPFTTLSVANIALRWSLDGTQYICGPDCPKWEITHSRILKPQPINLRIKNFSAIRTNFMCGGCCPSAVAHPNFPLVTEWDGRFGGIIPPNSAGSHGDSYNQFQFTDHTNFVVGDNIAFLGRLMNTIEVGGPILGAHINGVLFNAGFGFGTLPPGQNFWFLRLEVTATNIIWLGVKEYGETALGHYYKVASCDPSAPDCVTLEEDI
jgi:hypothetical protein